MYVHSRYSYGTKCIQYYVEYVCNVYIFMTVLSVFSPTRVFYIIHWNVIQSNPLINNSGKPYSELIPYYVGILKYWIILYTVRLKTSHKLYSHNYLFVINYVVAMWWQIKSVFRSGKTDGSQNLDSNFLQKRRFENSFLYNSRISQI